MQTLWAASVRHLLWHPAQLALALLGLALGVATIVAVDTATGSAGRAFALSMSAVSGPATHEISAGPAGVDEQLYARLARTLHVIRTAPVIEGYVTVDDQALQLVGLDPLAAATFGAAAGTAAAGRLGEDVMPLLRAWLARPGAVVMAADTARRLRLKVGDALKIDIGGGEVQGRLIGLIDPARPGTGSLLLTDIAQAQEWLGMQGRLSRIDLAVPGNAAAASAARASAVPGDAAAASTPSASASAASASAASASAASASAASASAASAASASAAGADTAPADAAAAAELSLLRRLLPAGASLTPASRQAQSTLDMTQAFATNLRALSLLALLVGLFLVYGTMSFAIVQRRRSLGIMRALGVTRGEIFRMVMLEAAGLALVGGALGLAAGALIARELVQLVTRTINDLYFVVEVNAVSLPVGDMALAFAGALAVALVAAFVPALEATGDVPQLTLRGSVLELRVRRLTRVLPWVGVILAAVCAALVLGSHRSIFAGFAALCLVLLSAAAFAPPLLAFSALTAARLAGRFTPLARVALEDIARSLSRTGVAVAALALAVAAMIGINVMVDSFRESLDEWLVQTLQADVYVGAPGPGFGRPERRLNQKVLADLEHVPGVAAFSASRRVVVDSPAGPITVDAVDPVPRPAAGTQRGDDMQPLDGTQLVEGNVRTLGAAFATGEILIAEPLAFRLDLHSGSWLTLITASGPLRFRIAGVFREYGSNRGSVRMSRAVYRRLWGDDAVSALALYLAPGAGPARVIGALYAAAAGRQALLIDSSTQVREISLAIFERTFVITRVLYWLAAAVAALGLISALLAWQLARGRELALMRSLGLTRLRTALLIESQTAFMGFIALVTAIPAGLIAALLLVQVINRRAFGWEIDLHLHPAQLSNAVVLSAVAAGIAGLYPAWRAAHARLAVGLREE